MSRCDYANTVKIRSCICTTNAYFQQKRITVTLHFACRCNAFYGIILFSSGTREIMSRDNLTDGSVNRKDRFRKSRRMALVRLSPYSAE